MKWIFWMATVVPFVLVVLWVGSVGLVAAVIGLALRYASAGLLAISRATTAEMERMRVWYARRIP